MEEKEGEKCEKIGKDLKLRFEAFVEDDHPLEAKLFDLFSGFDDNEGEYVGGAIGVAVYEQGCSVRAMALDYANSFS
ncbi:hypothetical protein ACFX12_025615 [Malus domestica]